MTISIGYRREQENQPEYFIGISELYNPIIHGASNIQFNSHFISSSREKLDGQFIASLTFTPEEFLTELSKYDVCSILDNFQRATVRYYNNVDVAYQELLFSDRYYRFNIMKNIGPIDDVTCCTLNTSPISILQRKWRNHKIREREIILRNANPRGIYYREVHCTWLPRRSQDRNHEINNLVHLSSE